MKQNTEIIISGIGVVSALGVGVEANFDKLRQSQSGLGEVSLFPTSLRVPVGEVKMSNAELNHSLDLPQTQTSSRTALLGMLAAREALQMANLPADFRVGLVSSTSVGGMDLTEKFYRQLLENEKSSRLRFAVHHDSADSTLQMADYLNITNFSTTISTACSSAANAIMFGARMIAAGLLDAVVAGGTDSLCQFTLNGFQSLKILDTEFCRPFDNSRAGLNLGEGAGFVVLQRADSHSLHDFGRLAGWANANDAYHQTATSPTGDGDFLSMSQALKRANLQPCEVDYINVHGTGTGNNDASEGAALVRLFGKKVPKFSSTKAFTGHTLAAAGGIEAVFALLALSRGTIFANLNFATPMNDCQLTPETQFSDQNPIRCAMSNSFGFGGNCSTLIFTKP